jgi:putative NADH-flavin reductase
MVAQNQGMKLTIFGATGRTGQHLVKQALQRAHQVTAFTRASEKLDASDENLRVVRGDVQDAASVDQAVAGADAVVSALGPTENKPVFAVSKGRRICGDIDGVKITNPAVKNLVDWRLDALE